MEKRVYPRVTNKYLIFSCSNTINRYLYALFCKTKYKDINNYHFNK